MTRWEEYRLELETLIEKLGFEEAYQIFRARTFDLIESGRIEGETVRELARQIEPLFESAAARYQFRFEQDYNETVSIVNNLYRDLGVDIKRDFKRISALETVNRSKWGVYSDETTRFITRQVRESRIKKETSVELKARFENSVDEKVVGYADTLAKSFVKGHGQELKNEKARIAEVDFFNYVGPPVVKLSHRFCIELTSSRMRTFSSGDIEQMRNGQLEPVSIHRGGYRCRHDWEPNPAYSGKDYKVVMITIPDGMRDITVGRHQ